MGVQWMHAYHFFLYMKRNYLMRLLHEGDLRRCFRDSGSVTYVSTLPAPSPSAPCISSFGQSLSAFDSNVRECTSCNILLIRETKRLGIRIKKE